MTIRIIDMIELRNAIRVSFENDNQIIELYDKAVKVADVSDIVEDVSKKILDYLNDVDGIRMYGVYERNALIGYFVATKGLLVSFALAMHCRTKKLLEEWWGLIKTQVGDQFDSYLWSHNKRAIKWLKKMGMMEFELENNITLLQCQ